MKRLAAASLLLATASAAPASADGGGAPGPAPVAAPAALPASSREPVPVVVVERRPHRGVGITLGAIAGNILGMWLGSEVAKDGDPGAYFPVWVAVASAGTLGGYALAGGFRPERADAALERGRASVRRAQAARAGSTGLPRLRLSAVDGFAGAEVAPLAHEARVALAP